MGGGFGPGVHFPGDFAGTIYMGLGAFQSCYYHSYQQAASSPFPVISQTFDVPFKCEDARELVEAGLAEWATDENVWFGW